MVNRPGRRRFGNIRKPPSGRWQASYVAPDGLRRYADGTFDRKGDAERWLAVGPAAPAHPGVSPSPARRRGRSDRGDSALGGAGGCRASIIEHVRVTPARGLAANDQRDEQPPHPAPGELERK
jgi:hypothetical protein